MLLIFKNIVKGQGQTAGLHSRCVVCLMSYDYLIVTKLRLIERETTNFWGACLFLNMVQWFVLDDSF